jgi:hypothetical protein
MTALRNSVPDVLSRPLRPLAASAQPQAEFQHVDKWIVDTLTRDSAATPTEIYAAQVLMDLRRPLMVQDKLASFAGVFPLFGKIAGQVWRIAGVSPLGDVLVRSVDSVSSGYEKRVCVLAISDWSSSALDLTLPVVTLTHLHASHWPSAPARKAPATPPTLAVVAGVLPSTSPDRSLD